MVANEAEALRIDPARPPDHFEFRESCSYPVGADVIGRELMRLGRPNGGLVYKEDVVEAARPEDSPIHDCGFTWDVNEAAAKQNLAEARRLIRSVIPVFVAPNARKLSTNPWMVPITTADHRRAHAPMEVVVVTPTYREQIIRDAQHGLAGWRRRLEGIEGAAAICKAIDLACRALDRLADREAAKQKKKGQSKRGPNARP